MALCERCGAYLERDPLPECFGCRNVTVDGQVRKLMPVEWRLLLLLWRSRHRGYLSVDRIMDLLYADDPNGGPDDNGIVYVTICRMRRLLRGSGYAIESRYGAGWLLREATQ